MNAVNFTGCIYFYIENYFFHYGIYWIKFQEAMNLREYSLPIISGNADVLDITDINQDPFWTKVLNRILIFLLYIHTRIYVYS